MGKYKDCLTRSVYLFFFPHEFTGSFIGMTLRVHALLTQTMTQTDYEIAFITKDHIKTTMITASLCLLHPPSNHTAAL